jgi:O-antigen ligase
MTCGLIVFMGTFLCVRRHNAWRWVGAVSAVLCLCAAALSLTRSVWLGVGVAVIVVMLATPRLRRWTPVVVGGAVGLGLGLAAVIPGLSSTFTSRAGTERSAYDRLLTNDAAARIIQVHPLTGIGWGRFIVVGNDWVRQAGGFPLTNTTIEVHNVFLSRAAETGVPGAILWGLAMLLGPVAVVARPFRQGDLVGWRLCASAAVLIWIFPSMLSPNPYPLPNYLVWLLGGIAGGEWLVRSAGTGRASRLAHRDAPASAGLGKEVDHG